MSIGHLNFCLDGVPGVAEGHIHAQEVRTFTELSDWPEVCEVLQNKFLRAAVAAGPGGGITIHRRDDGHFEAQFHINQECAGDPCISESLGDVHEWVRDKLPRIFNPIADGSATAN